MPEALAHLGPPACTSHTGVAAHHPPDPGGPLAQGALFALSPHRHRGPTGVLPGALSTGDAVTASLIVCSVSFARLLARQRWCLITDHLLVLPLHPLQGLAPCSSSKSISVGEWFGGTEPRVGVKSGPCGRETCDSGNKSTEL